MPTYLARCVKCDFEFEYFQTIPERNNAPWHCGVPPQRLINAPMVAPLFAAYQAVGGDRRYIKTKRAHRDFLKEFNKVEIGNDASRAPPKISDEEFKYQQQEARKELDHEMNVLKDAEKVLTS